MTESSFDHKLKKKHELGLNATFSLEDFRAGHWPGCKTPPWWLNEMWEGENTHLRKHVEQLIWPKKDDLFIKSGVIQTKDETHEVDIYARRDSRHGKDYFGFVAYPKEKSFNDFWNEDGTEKEREDE